MWLSYIGGGAARWWAEAAAAVLGVSRKVVWNYCKDTLEELWGDGMINESIVVDLAGSATMPLQTCIIIVSASC